MEDNQTMTPAQKAGATNRRRHEQRREREALKKRIVAELEKIVAAPDCDPETRQAAVVLLAKVYHHTGNAYFV